MARGGFSKAARNRRWRSLYGTVARSGKFKGQVYTYRLIALEYHVSPMTVWAALNKDRLPVRAPAEREAPRPLSLRIPLTNREYAAVKATAGKGKMATFVRAVLFGDRPPLALEPPLDPLPDEPTLEGE